MATGDCIQSLQSAMLYAAIIKNNKENNVHIPSIIARRLLVKFVVSIGNAFQANYMKYSRMF